VKKQEAAVEDLGQELEKSRKLIAALADENAAIRREAVQLAADMEAIQYQLEDIDRLKAAMLHLSQALEQIEARVGSESAPVGMNTAQ